MANRPKIALLEIFGTNVKLARVRAKLTQEGLAAAIESDQSFVSKIERGASAATIETIERLAIALGVRPAELFDESMGRRQG